MKTVTINKRRYAVPESWDELTADQLVEVMEILFVKTYTAEQAVLQLLRVFTGMSHYRFLRTKAEELDEFLYLTAFLLDPDFAFTRQLLPVFDGLYGPDDAVANLRMKEFTFTEDHFLRWCESGKEDEASLNELVAVLYRPAPAGYDHNRNPDGDHRVPYNQNTASWYARHYVSKWPRQVRLAIAHWYDGCRRKLAADNDDVFGGAGDPARYGLVSVMLNVAESHVFGDFQKVEEQYVNLVMMQLNELVEKARQIEAKRKA